MGGKVTKRYGYELGFDKDLFAGSPEREQVNLQPKSIPRGQRSENKLQSKEEKKYPKIKSSSINVEPGFDKDLYNGSTSKNKMKKSKISSKSQTGSSKSLLSEDDASFVANVEEKNDNEKSSTKPGNPVGSVLGSKLFDKSPLQVNTSKKQTNDNEVLEEEIKYSFHFGFDWDLFGLGSQGETTTTTTVKKQAPSNEEYDSTTVKTRTIKNPIGSTMGSKVFSRNIPTDIVLPPAQGREPEPAKECEPEPAKKREPEPAKEKEPVRDLETPELEISGMDKTSTRHPYAIPFEERQRIQHAPKIDANQMESDARFTANYRKRFKHPSLQKYKETPPPVNKTPTKDIADTESYKITFEDNLKTLLYASDAKFVANVEEKKSRKPPYLGLKLAIKKLNESRGGATDARFSTVGKDLESSEMDRATTRHPDPIAGVDTKVVLRNCIIPDELGITDAKLTVNKNSKMVKKSDKPSGTKNRKNRTKSKSASTSKSRSSKKSSKPTDKGGSKYSKQRKKAGKRNPGSTTN